MVFDLSWNQWLPFCFGLFVSTLEISIEVCQLRVLTDNFKYANNISYLTLLSVAAFLFKQAPLI